MATQERPESACCPPLRSEEHTSELQSQSNLVCRLLLEKKNKGFPADPDAPRRPPRPAGADRRRDIGPRTAIDAGAGVCLDQDLHLSECRRRGAVYRLD